MTNRLDLKTPDGVSQNIERIAALFPHCVTETTDGKQIDFDLLRQELSTDIVEGPKERYRLEWPGKREAIVTANMPTTNTLRPVREDSVNFDTTENLYIEGDNLEVLKLLQESYLGKVKMIYIDPPYNTGNDFVYRDNFAQDSDEYKADSGMTDELGNRLVANPETAGRYHSDWLTMMYPRLKLARNLLSDDGVIFISIGQDELSNVLKLCNEIFSENNLLGIISRQMKSGGGSQGKYFAHNIDYIIVYAKIYDVARYFKGKISDELEKKVYTQVETEGPRKGEYYRTMGLYQSSLGIRPGLRYWIKCPDGSYVIPQGEAIPLVYEEGEKIMPKTSDGVWRWSYEKYVQEKNNGNIEFKKTDSGVLINEKGESAKWNVYTKIWLKDRQEEGQIPSDIISKFENRHSSKELSSLNIPFDFAKPIDLIKYLIYILQQDKDIIILDFFSGSATTAHAVMQLNAEDGGNRKFIMVQLPEKTDEKSEAYKAGYKNICEIGKERIRRAGKKLTPAPQPPKGGAESASLSLFGTDEANSELKTQNPKLDIGFRVYRLDTSNMQDVYYRPQDYKQGMMTELFANHIKPDRTADDLVAQVMLDWGLPLSLPIEQTTIAGKTVYKVAGNALYCCFDEHISEDFARAVAPEKPLRIVFHDYAFANDTAKENVRQLLKQLSAETEMRVI